MKIRFKQVLIIFNYNQTILSQNKFFYEFQKYILNCLFLSLIFQTFEQLSKKLHPSYQFCDDGSWTFPCHLHSQPEALPLHQGKLYSSRFLQFKETAISVLCKIIFLKIVLSKKCFFPVSTMRQKREKRIAAILVVIVVVFITCNLPRVIINLYEVSKYYI